MKWLGGWHPIAINAPSRSARIKSFHVQCGAAYVIVKPATSHVSNVEASAVSALGKLVRIHLPHSPSAPPPHVPHSSHPASGSSCVAAPPNLVETTNSATHGAPPSSPAVADWFNDAAVVGNDVGVSAKPVAKVKSETSTTSPQLHDLQLPGDAVDAGAKVERKRNPAAPTTSLRGKHGLSTRNTDVSMSFERPPTVPLPGSRNTRSRNSLPSSAPVQFPRGGSSTSLDHSLIPAAYLLLRLTCLVLLLLLPTNGWDEAQAWAVHQSYCNAPLTWEADSLSKPARGRSAGRGSTPAACECMEPSVATTEPRVTEKGAPAIDTFRDSVDAPALWPCAKHTAARRSPSRASGAASST